MYLHTLSRPTARPLCSTGRAAATSPCRPSPATSPARSGTATASSACGNERTLHDQHHGTDAAHALRRLHPQIQRRRVGHGVQQPRRSEEHTSELQSLMRISYAVFCLKKKKKNKINIQ